MSRIFIAIVCVFLAIEVEAGNIVIIDESKPKSEKEALLILPGFGSITHGVRKIKKYYRDRGYDLYIPDYISKKSLEECTIELDEFLHEQTLYEYKKVHVLSYIVGAWTLNSWLETHEFRNLGSVVYDRSPMQERAPYVLTKDIPFIAKLIAGKTLRELSETPYREGVYTSSPKIGILIETVPTKMMIRHKESSRDLGPLSWKVKDLGQPHDDFIYIPYNHDDLYKEFDGAGTEILYFFKNGVFSEKANRVEPVGNPLEE